METNFNARTVSKRLWFPY